MPQRERRRTRCHRLVRRRPRPAGGHARRAGGPHGAVPPRRWRFLVLPADERYSASRLHASAERARLRDRCVDRSPDKDQEYFADGISEELLNLLAQVPELRVIARTSSFSFKDKDVEIAEIARRLNVANVLEGSVRRSGDTLRITAQLVRASDSSHLWSQTYDRQTTDECSRCRTTSRRRSSSNSKSSCSETRRKRGQRIHRRMHYSCRLAKLPGSTTAAAFEQAADLYQQALTIDPNYAPAWDGIAEACFYQIDFGALTSHEGLPRAREAIRRALTTDPLYAPAYARAALIEGLAENDLTSAALQIERGLVAPIQALIVPNFFHNAILCVPQDPKASKTLLFIILRSLLEASIAERSRVGSTVGRRSSREMLRWPPS